MIKVCHLTSVHKSQDPRIMKKQCTSLGKSGYETYLVAGGKSYEENGVKVVGVGEFNGGRINRMTKKARAVFKKAVELDCDIYQLHDPELLPYALKLKRKGKIVVYDSHENTFLQIKQKRYIPKYSRTFVANLFRLYFNFILSKIDAVLFPCLVNGNNLFDGLCKKSIIIGNEPILKELYAFYNETNRNIRRSVCYIGAMTYNRGVFHLMKACEKAKITLILAGNFSQKDFEIQLKNDESYKCVDYRGVFNRKQLIDILNEALIGVSTLLNVGQYNSFDNFATKVYEYMSMGLPVILSDYAYSRKINEKYEFAILVDPENVEEISNAIKFLLDNPERAKQMGKNGRRAIEEEFNWGNEEKKLLQLYKELSDEIRANRLRKNSN